MLISLLLEKTVSFIVLEIRNNDTPINIINTITPTTFIVEDTFTILSMMSVCPYPGS